MTPALTVAATALIIAGWAADAWRRERRAEWPHRQPDARRFFAAAAILGVVIAVTALIVGWAA